ncbi:IclR family transcriptional regulator [Sulfoacidibacillus thermotolerans]|uniref:IclR family transcriptional regulator n=1 Tax=Sulfoacidibacillus thermotolerans TaxID=1765684 RepID=A0A2U3D766_SULT2|nr:IclR family transcriptional regulator [Sulfoacidibacillus thermotolerans]PWI57130.1 hypothetical protein BM613_10265 [Sulfoacidibacillus thermotolerans]
MKNEDDKNLLLVTASNSLKILTLFSDRTPLLGVTEISRRLGLAKSIVSRIIQTFVAEGVLERDELTGKYRLGTALLELGLIAAECNPVFRASQQVVEKLHQQTGLDSYLLLLDQNESLFLLLYKQPNSAWRLFCMGSRTALPNTIGGLTMLAFLEPMQAQQVMQSHFGCTSEMALLRDVRYLKEIEVSGYAYGEEPLCQEIRSVACPIFDPTGKVLASIAVSGGIQRVKLSQVEELLASVAKAARHISHSLYPLLRSFPPIE